MFNFSHQIDSLKATIIGLTLILATAIIGLIWLSIGLYAFAVDLVGHLWGPIVLGALCFLPLLIYIAVRLLNPKDKRSKQQRMYDAAFANTSVGSISRMIETMSAHSPFVAAIVAVVGGFVASRFPQFLQIFSELVTAYGDELARHKVRKAEDNVRKAREEEHRGSTPPPPDVEPVSKRRGKAKADVY